MKPEHPKKRTAALYKLAGVLFRRQRLSGHFDEIYSAHGAPSIPPETLLKGKILQALYTVRSDRQLCARLQTDLMFRWFVDLPLDQPVFDASTYSKNQQRLLAHEVADLFFAEVVTIARRRGWVSDEHFSVDGTLINAWASMKSFRPKGEDQGPGAGNSWQNFRGEKRSNATHESTTDPEAKLLRKGPGKEARLCFAGHAAMENRHGLCVLFDIKSAVGAPESAMAVEQMTELRNCDFRPQSVGADTVRAILRTEGARIAELPEHQPKPFAQSLVGKHRALEFALNQGITSERLTRRGLNLPRLGVLHAQHSIIQGPTVGAYAPFYRRASASGMQNCG